MYELSNDLDLMPKTWYRFCVSYDSHNNHKVILTVDGEILLEVNETTLLGANFNWTSLKLVEKIYLGRCTDNDSRAFGVRISTMVFLI